MREVFSLSYLLSIKGLHDLFSFFGSIGDPASAVSTSDINMTLARGLVTDWLSSAKAFVFASSKTIAGMR